MDTNIETDTLLQAFDDSGGITQAEIDAIAASQPDQALLRARIKTRRLLDLLHDNSIGRAWLSASQLKSIGMLLDRAMPDKASKQVAEPGHSGSGKQAYVIAAPPMLADGVAWMDKYGPDRKHG